MADTFDWTVTDRTVTGADMTDTNDWTYTDQTVTAGEDCPDWTEATVGTGGGGGGGTGSGGPDTIVGLISWYNPTIQATSATGTVSNPIVDSSGGGNPLDHAPVPGILLQASGINGKQSFNLTGNPMVAETSHFFSTTQPISIAAVIKNGGGATDQGVFGIPNAGTPFITTTAAGAFGTRAGANLAGGVADTAAHFVVAVLNGASSSLWVDNVQVATGNAGSNGAGGGPIYLGEGDVGGAKYFFGLVGDCWWYSIALSSAQIGGLHTWVVAKWATP